MITITRTCTTCRFLVRDADGPAPFFCRMLKLPLATSDLRLDCPEHRTAVAPAG